MNKFEKVLGVGLLIAIVIAIGAYSFPRTAEPTLGRTGTAYPHGVTIGSSGTNNAQVIDGSCALVVQAGTVAASTTAPFDCAVTGVTSSFNSIIGNIGTSTTFGSGQVMGFWIVGAKASSTAGYITFVLFNGTGAAANPSTLGYASTTYYHAVLTQ